MHIAHKHLKRCSTSFVLRKIQIETTMRYHYTSIRMAKSETLPYQTLAEQELPFIADGNVKQYSHWGR